MKNHSKAVRKDWIDVKQHIKELNLDLYNLIDHINPDLPILEMSYSYGQLITDQNYYYHPENGEIRKYHTSELPYFLSIDKKVEIFLESISRIIPDTIYSKGDFFPKGSNLGQKEIKTRPESPFLWASGIRNILIAPINEDTTYYSNYKKKYDINDEINPDQYIHHYNIVKHVLEKNKSNWCSRMYAFPHEWQYNISNNKKWLDFKVYLLRQEIELERFRSNLMFLDYALHEIVAQKKISIKSYTLELLREICLVSLGGVPAYCPSIDDQGVPSREFIDDYIRNYSNRYIPVIYETRYIQDADNCVYIPLHVSNNFLLNSKKVRITLYLNELSEYIDIIFNGLSKHPLTQESDFGKLKSNTKVTVYSSQGSGKNIKSSDNLVLDDYRFKLLNERYSNLTIDGFNKRSIFNHALISIKRIDN
jgi:hypothetical protein